MTSVPYEIIWTSAVPRLLAAAFATALLAALIIRAGFRHGKGYLQYRRRPRLK